jgi:hypothetical protein
MPGEFAIATRCSASDISSGWLAQLNSPRTHCRPSEPTEDGRYCCSETVARTLSGGRLLPTNGDTAQQTAQQPVPGGKQLDTQIYTYGDPTANAVNQGVNQGTADMGLAPPQQGAPPPATWINENWPWLLVGGVAVVGVVAVAVTVLSEPEPAPPALPPMRV